MCSFRSNLTERQILWSFCLVDFYTLTLQLPIQTANSVAPELQVFVSSLEFQQNEHTPGKVRVNWELIDVHHRRQI